MSSEAASTRFFGGISACARVGVCVCLFVSFACPLLPPAVSTLALYCVCVCVFVCFAMFQAACYATYEFVEENKSLIEILNMSSQMSSQMPTHLYACYLWIELNCENKLSVDVMSN